jgi:hypothetical protein
MAAAEPKLESLGSAEDESGFLEFVHSSMFDPNGPKYPKKKLSAKERYTSDVLLGFSEILMSLDRLEDLAFLVVKAPHGNSRVSKESYLQILVEAHLNEVYVLQQRIAKYLKRLVRAFKEDPRYETLRDLQAKALRVVEAAFNPVTAARSSHVHEWRFRDQGINRLEMMNSISRFGPKGLRAYYRSERARTYKQWKKTLAENYANVEEIVGEWLGALFPLIFDERTGELLVPAKLR